MAANRHKAKRQPAVYAIPWGARVTPADQIPVGQLVVLVAVDYTHAKSQSIRVK